MRTSHTHGFRCARTHTHTHASVVPFVLCLTHASVCPAAPGATAGGGGFSLGGLLGGGEAARDLKGLGDAAAAEAVRRCGIPYTLVQVRGGGGGGGGGQLQTLANAECSAASAASIHTATRRRCTCFPTTHPRPHPFHTPRCTCLSSYDNFPSPLRRWLGSRTRAGVAACVWSSSRRRRLAAPPRAPGLR